MKISNQDKVKYLVAAGMTVAAAIKEVRDQYTVTSTQTKPKVMKHRMSRTPLSTHNDMNMTYIPNTVKSRGLKNYDGTFTYIESFQKVSSELDGRQLIYQPKYMMTRQQLQGITSNNRTLEYCWEADPWLLDPYRNAPTAGTLPAGNGPNPIVNRNSYLGFVMCNHTMQLLNMETIPCDVQVIYYQCRNDAIIAPQNVWDDEVRAQNMGQTPQVRDQIINGSTARGGASNIVDYGMSPESYPTINKIWHIVAKHRVILQPGDQHNISTTFRLGRKIEYEKLLELDDNIAYVKDYTIVPLIIARGAMVGIATAADQPSNEVTYGPTKLGIICRNRYVLASIPETEEKVNRVYNGTLVAAKGVSGQVEKQIDSTDNDKVVEGQ